MYANILVAIDGSPVSDAALRHAIRLAQEQHAKLQVLHVIDIIGVTWATEDILDAYKQRGQSLLDQATYLGNLAGLQTTSALLETGVVGQRTAEIVAEHARAVAADLVVLGSHGYRGLSHLFLGSVAEGVARLCTMPVLIVHGPLEAAG